MKYGLLKFFLGLLIAVSVIVIVRFICENFPFSSGEPTINAIILIGGFLSAEIWLLCGPKFR